MPTVFNLPPNWPPIKAIDLREVDMLPEPPAGWIFEEEISWFSYLKRGITAWRIFLALSLCIILTLSGVLVYGFHRKYSQSLTGAPALATKLAQTGLLPITTVGDMTADAGDYIGENGEIGPEIPVSRATLNDGTGRGFFEFQGYDRGEGVLILQFASSDIASVEDSWLFTDGQNLGANPVRCDNFVFVGDWLDQPTSDATLQSALDSAGITCTTASGLHATGA